MKTRGPVIAAVDRSAQGDTVLRHAHERALAAGVPLVIAHVLPTRLSHDPLFPQARGTEALATLDLRAQAHGDLVARVGRVTHRRRAEYTVVHPEGDVAMAMTGLAKQLEASLLVVGPGRIAIRVIRRGSSPVLVAREGSEGCVLGATDFSDPDFPALTRAASEARQLDRPLCFFHALRPAECLIRLRPHLTMPEGPTPRTEQEQVVEDVRRQLRLYARELHTPGEALATVGSPAEEISRLAGQLRAGLVVIATRGREGLLRLLRGSVAETTVLSAPCSVLVVRKTW